MDLDLDLEKIWGFHNSLESAMMKEPTCHV